MTDELAPIRRAFAPDDLRPLLAAAGVDRSILVQTRSSPEETAEFLGIAAALDRDLDELSSALAIANDGPRELARHYECGSFTRWRFVVSSGHGSQRLAAAALF